MVAAELAEELSAAEMRDDESSSCDAVKGSVRAPERDEIGLDIVAFMEGSQQNRLL